MKEQKLFVEHCEDYVAIEGDQDPSQYGWWVLNTDGTECWDVEGPFCTEEEANQRLDEIEEELRRIAA